MESFTRMWNFKNTCSAFKVHNIWLSSSWISCGFSIYRRLNFPKISPLCLHDLHNCSHQTVDVSELFSPLQEYFSSLNLTAILNMLEAIFQASFSNFLEEIEPGTWNPLGVFVLRDITVTDRK